MLHDSPPVIPIQPWAFVQVGGNMACTKIIPKTKKGIQGTSLNKVGAVSPSEAGEAGTNDNKLQPKP